MLLAGVIWLAMAAPAMGATITMSAPASLPLGSMASATAAVTGGDPSGVVFFRVFATGDCSGEPAFLLTSEPGTAYTSQPFIPTDFGTYKWRAYYVGAGGNSETACDAAGSTTVVGKRVPSLGPSEVVTAIAGQTIAQSQTFSGAEGQTGSITFSLYGPNDTTCTRPSIYNSTVGVTPDSNDYNSGPFVVPAAGTYRWKASYTGDASHEAATATSCVPPVAVLGDRSRPLLGTPSISPSRFKAGKKATIKYTLNEPATVAFTVERALSGRRSGKRCVKPTGKNAKKKKCTRYAKVKGGFSHKGKKGTNRVTFTGKLGKKKLAPGTYRLRAVATDAAKNKSALKTRAFKILR